jgi:hypothetical protein
MGSFQEDFRDMVQVTKREPRRPSLVDRGQARARLTNVYCTEPSYLQVLHIYACYTITIILRIQLADLTRLDLLARLTERNDQER